MQTQMDCLLGLVRSIALISTIFGFWIPVSSSTAQPVILEKLVPHRITVEPAGSARGVFVAQTPSAVHIYVGSRESVSARVIASDEKVVSDNLKADSDGLVFFETPSSGTFTFEVHADSVVSESYTVLIGLADLIDSEFYWARINNESTDRESSVEWIREKGIQVQTVEAESGFEDLQQAKSLIGDARLVALGEATHGTREFFQFKHRFVEFLVEQMGFTVFAIEASVAEARAIDDYINLGIGDPEKALAGLYFWTWNTEEVLEMIRWMRRYNANPANNQKIRFTGFDAQYGTVAYHRFREFIRDNAPDELEAFDSVPYLSLFRQAYTEVEFHKLGEVKQRIAAATIDSIIARLDERFDPDESWTTAKILGRTLQQASVIRISPQVRDSIMAENVRWIAEEGYPDSKVVYWAHNMHVSKRKSSSGYQPMGAFLDAWFADQMVTIGFAFGNGSFQSRPLGDRLGATSFFHVPPLDSTSFDRLFYDTGLPYVLVDLESMASNEESRRYLSVPRAHRGNIGSMFDPNWSSSFGVREVLIEEWYDAIFFSRVSNPTMPNPSGNSPDGHTLAYPANLGFEFDQSRVSPMYWIVNEERAAAFGYSVEVVSDQAETGKNSLRISRESHSPYGSTFVSVNQRISADAYRGKRISFSGAVKTDLSDDRSAAYLWTDVTGRSKGCREIMLETPISVAEWTRFSIECEIGDSADFIEVGLAFEGEGIAWFDSFEFQVE